MDRITRLFTCLVAAQGNWKQIVDFFLEHSEGPYIQEILSTELRNLAHASDYVVNGGVNQYTYTPLISDDFEYTIRIVSPFSRRPHLIKWLGMRQAFAFKGNGRITVRKLQIPQSAQLENFVAGVPLELADVVHFNGSGFIAANHINEIIDIDEATEPSVVEVLTYKKDARGAMWTFENLKSAYSEQSSSLVSRFLNVIELSRAMGQQVPDDIYRTAIRSGNSQLALAALEVALVEELPDAFGYLHASFESEDEELRDSAERLWRLMTDKFGERRAH